MLRFLGDHPLFRMVDFLLENKGLDFSKTEIAEGSKVSRATLFKYWGEIEKYGMVKVTRRFGKTKLFTLNTKNVLTKRIIELEKTLIAEAMKENVITV